MTKYHDKVTRLKGCVDAVRTMFNQHLEQRVLDPALGTYEEFLDLACDAYMLLQIEQALEPFFDFEEHRAMDSDVPPYISGLLDRMDYIHSREPSKLDSVAIYPRKAAPLYDALANSWNRWWLEKIRPQLVAITQEENNDA